MKVLGIIPARGGSKSVPKKNIKMLAGKPLIAWAIDVAEKSNLTKTIVTTDDEEIKAVSEKYGGYVPFIRPSDLATDRANAVPVMQHAVNFMEAQGEKYDAIMMIQPTAPMRIVEDLNKCIEIMEADPELEGVISVTDAAEYPERMKYMNENHILIDPPFCEAYENQARQELPKIYQKNGQIYLVRRDTMMNKNSFKGNKAYGYYVSDKRSVNIDNEFHFMQADWLMSNFKWEDWK